MAYELTSQDAQFLQVLGLMARKEGRNWMVRPAEGGKLSKSVAHNFQASRVVSDGGDNVKEFIDGEVVRGVAPQEVALEKMTVTMYKRGTSAPWPYELAFGYRSGQGWKTWEECTTDLERKGQQTDNEILKQEAAIKARRFKKAESAGLGVAKLDDIVEKIVPAMMKARDKADDAQTEQTRGPGRPPKQ